MAYIDCKLKSQLLQRTVAVKLYFPTDLPAEVGNTVKGVLTLLHGYTNCGEDWLQGNIRCWCARWKRTARLRPSFTMC